MASKLRTLVCAALIGAALMAPVGAGAQDEDGVEDLDQIEGDQLDGYLEDELDDVFDEIDPDENVSSDELVKAILYALSDAGDTGDETYIDENELEAEMNEAGTSLADVVTEAVEAADAMAAAGTPGLSLASAAGPELAYRGQPRARFGVTQSKNYITQTIGRR